MNPRLAPEVADELRALWTASQAADDARQESVRSRNARWKALYRSGIGCTEIARASGCNRVTVARVVTPPIGT